LTALRSVSVEFSGVRESMKHHTLSHPSYLMQHLLWHNPFKASSRSGHLANTPGQLFSI